jgi:integration host factor subunit alpha
MEFAIESLETPALTKAQLADLLFEQIGLNKRESKDMIDAFFDLISASLVEGARTSRSPVLATSRSAPRRRGPAAIRARAKPFPIQARRVVTFHASHKLKDQIQVELPHHRCGLTRNRLLFCISSATGFATLPGS